MRHRGGKEIDSRQLGFVDDRAGHFQMETSWWGRGALLCLPYLPTLLTLIIKWTHNLSDDQVRNLKGMPNLIPPIYIPHAVSS